MMNVWSPLTTHWAVNLEDCSSRGGAKIDTIIHHHTASANKAATLALFAPGGREVTPNYFIAGREIWGIVPENYRAFTSGSYEDDRRAINYEILNSSGAPNWGFDPVTLATVARLDADIARRYGIPLRHSQPGFMEHRNIYEWFGRGYATACAGPSFDMNQVISDTAALMEGGGAKVSTPKRKRADMLGMRVNDGLGRYGKVGGQIFATFSPSNDAITYLTANDANQVSVSFGFPFANLTYAAYEGYCAQASGFIDATVNPPVRLTGPKGAPGTEAIG